MMKQEVDPYYGEQRHDVTDVYCFDYYTNLISLNNIIYNAIYDTDVIMYQYRLKPDFGKKDTKGLFYHNIILILCDKLLAYKGSINILYYNTLATYEDENITKSINYIVNILRRRTHLPLFILENDCNFDDFVNKLEIHNKDSYEEVIYYVNKTLNLDKTKFTLQRLRKFLNTYNLKFLNDVYFNRLDVKMSALS